MFILSLFASAALAQLCAHWQPAESVGTLDRHILREASGLAISRQFPNRAYHINDSGDGPFFYITGLDGHFQQRVEVEGGKPRDTEDLALGPCGDRTCLFLADIGDNDAVRTSIEVRIVEEAEIFGQPVRARTVRLNYPDGPHNAEAFAVYPDGTWVIVTKESTGEGPAPARVYANRPGTDRLVRVGQIDIPQLLRGEKDAYKVVTGMSLSSDGLRFLILTYGTAFEFQFDLRTAPYPPLVEHRNFARVPILNLSQQESIAYLPDDRGFMYSTEYDPPESPFMRMLCH